MASEPPGAAAADALHDLTPAGARALLDAHTARHQRVHRFAGTERALHLVQVVAFFGMLATGLALFLPFLAQTFGNRPVVKALHLIIAALWLTAIVLVVLLGDRGVLRRTRRQFESLDAADLMWLRSKAARSRPQGRFNGGQKLHGIVQGAFTFLFFLSGSLLWLGERNTTFRLPGTIALHDLTMVAATAFVIGHISIALSAAGRPSLSGMVDGTVPASYAAQHHGQWDPASEPIERRAPLTPLRASLAAFVLGVGMFAAVLLAGG